MPEQMPELAPWLQLGFAVAVAWYLLTKQMPRIEERAEKRDAAFVAALKEERDEHKAENHLLAQSQERQTERIIEAVEVVGQEVRVYTNGRGGANR